MFVPAPIEKDFVPYTKRSVLRRNAGLFVDGTFGRGRTGSRVVPQQGQCSNGPADNGKQCGPGGVGRCLDGQCDYPVILQ
jgi:hypothetical protein